MPLLSKDTIKEALSSLTDPQSITVEESKALGAASFDVVFTLLQHGTSAVVEASWNPAIAGPLLQALPHRLIEVHCRCDPDTARRRYIDRASQRHWVHTDHDRFNDDQLWSNETAGPLLLGEETIEVDTTQPVDIQAIAKRVIALTLST